MCAADGGVVVVTNGVDVRWFAVSAAVAVHRNADHLLRVWTGHTSCAICGYPSADADAAACHAIRCGRSRIARQTTEAVHLVAVEVESNAGRI